MIAALWAKAQGYPRSRWIFALVLGAIIIGAALWFRSSPEQQTQRVGREFASMDECLAFIMSDIGDSLEFITDKPGDISGHSTKKRLFYRCELKVTGTRGPVLEGRWDRLK